MCVFGHVHKCNNFSLMAGTIDVITFNCQGLRSSASRETLFQAQETPQQDLTVVAVSSLFQPRFTMVSSATDPMGRFVSAQFVVDDNDFTICNVYGPNTCKVGALFL